MRTSCLLRGLSRIQISDPIHYGNVVAEPPRSAVDKNNFLQPPSRSPCCRVNRHILDHSESIDGKDSWTGEDEESEKIGDDNTKNKKSPSHRTLVDRQSTRDFPLDNR